MTPDFFDKPFRLGINASDIGVGGVLVKEDEEGIDHPLKFYQRNWINIRKGILLWKKNTVFDFDITALWGVCTFSRGPNRGVLHTITLSFPVQNEE